MESLKIGGSYFGFVSSIFGKIARKILPNPGFFRVIYHGRIRFTKKTPYTNPRCKISGCPRELGSMVIGSMRYFTYFQMGYAGVITH